MLFLSQFLAAVFFLKLFLNDLFFMAQKMYICISVFLHVGFPLIKPAENISIERTKSAKKFAQGIIAFETTT